MQKKDLFQIQKKIYSNNFDWEYCAQSWHGKSRLRKALKMLLKSKIERLLDIGCGDGFFLHRFPSEIEKFGVDITNHRNPGFNYVISDVNFGLPFKSNSFDAIFAGEIIEHIISPEFFLSECWNALSPTGCLVLTTPNLCSLKNLILLLLGNQLFGVEAGSERSSGHIRAFSPNALADLIRKSGFRLDILITDRIPIPFAPDNSFFSRMEELIAVIFKRWGDCLIIQGTKLKKD